MSDPYWYWDLARVFIAAGALWLGVLILKLCWLRWRHPDPDRQDVHPLTYLSFALSMFSIAVFRIYTLGLPFDIRLPITFLVVVLGIIGVLKRVRLGSLPTRRR